MYIFITIQFSLLLKITTSLQVTSTKGMDHLTVTQISIFHAPQLQFIGKILAYMVLSTPVSETADTTMMMSIFSYIHIYNILHMSIECSRP